MKKVFKELMVYKLPILLLVATVFGGVLSNLSLPTYLSDIINVGIVGRDMGMILRTGGIMLCFTVLAMICNILTGFLAARISMGFGRSLRSEVFAKVQRFSLEEFDKFSTASLITRTNNDMMQIQQFVMMFLRVILMAPVMCIGGIILAFMKSPRMSSVLLISIPLMIVAVALVARKAIPISTVMQKKIDRINLVMREKLTGLRVIRAFGTEQFESDRFGEANTDLMRNTVQMQRAMATLGPVLMLVLNATIVGLLWFGGNQATSGTILTGDIIAIIQYVMQIMMSVTMLSMIFVMYPRAAASADRIVEVLDTPQGITAPQEPKRGGTHGCLEFRNVSFYFEGATDPAIKDISFSAGPGETTAIIGSTGSGKTALVNLIPRFYDVQEGEVLVDGTNVKEYDPEVLRAKIGFVPQKALLFQGTIESNIRFGAAQAGDERVRQAAEIAQSTDFIISKDEGFGAPIAQGGSNVSGGQRQRLAIARAVVRDPEIYVFDDSFSALDFKTDVALRNALAPETKDATVIIVAQRVSTIMEADRILVLDEGELVGIGTHKELIANCETYREIVRSQLSQEEMGA